MVALSYQRVQRTGVRKGGNGGKRVKNPKDWAISRKPTEENNSF
jgi:hypothetical protein